MCSTHTRLVKKYRDVFEELQAQAQRDFGPSDMTKLKVTKTKAIDEFGMLQECSVVDRYLMILNHPSPSPKKINQLQLHLEELVNVFRR